MSITETPRGTARSRAYVAQVHDFSGLRWGTITPTDIDGFVEFGNEVFVFIEAKYENTELPDGQRLALERLCDACAAGGKLALLIVATHNCAAGVDIDVAALHVSKYRSRGKWRTKRAPITVRELIDSFLRFADGDARIAGAEREEPEGLQQHAEWLAAFEREQRQAPLSGCNDGTICPRPA